MIAIPIPPSAGPRNRPGLGLQKLLDLRKLETGAGVRHDHLEAVVVDHEGDLDRAVTIAVGVPHGVAAGLGDREPQVRQQLRPDRQIAHHAAERQPREQEVVGLRREGEPDDRFTHCAAPSLRFSRA